MRQTRRAVLSTVGATTLSGLGLAGGASADATDCEYGTIQPDAEAGTVDFWHARTTEGAELVDTIKNRFDDETRHTLQTSQIPNGTYIAKLQSSIPSGRGPYVFELAYDKVGTYRSLVADQSGQLDVPDCMLTDKALAVSQFDGKRFGLPFASETVALLYNEDIVDSPPETFDRTLF